MFSKRASNDHSVGACRAMTIHLPANRELYWAALGVVLLALGGCSQEVPEASLAQIRIWIPSATVRAAPQSLDVFKRDRPSGATSAQVGLVVSSTLIGQPRTYTKSRWATWLPTSSASVSQDLLVRTSDGRYFTTTYAWRNDPIVLDCVPSPASCARFAEPTPLSEDQAKSLLSGSPLTTPAIYQKFFGGIPPSGRS